jgi:hypothetical protein
MTILKVNTRSIVESVPEPILSPASRALEVFTDGFDPTTPTGRRNFPDSEAQLGWFRTSGLIVVRNREMVAPTVEQLEKLRDLIALSDEPLYFMVVAAADNRIAQIDSFKDKAAWVQSLKDWGLNASNSIFEHAVADKKTQARSIEKLLNRARAEKL